ncbi:hypothetical protein DFH09DRAFT_1086523 [Mycena vulgaris]|nr:hypothetical protein DFH09DRAFT_1086523 [Mycena vulgaris]
MAKRAVATSEKALMAAAVAAAEAKELEDGEKPPKRPRGRPKKPTPVAEPVTEEPLLDAKAALAQSIQEAKNIVIECIDGTLRVYTRRMGLGLTQSYHQYVSPINEEGEWDSPLENRTRTINGHQPTPAASSADHGHVHIIM